MLPCCFSLISDFYRGNMLIYEFLFYESFYDKVYFVAKMCRRENAYLQRIIYQIHTQEHIVGRR